jgi:HD-GYP domain-containing protein (c-di-GMP phosphodiesterase class II)
MFMKNEPFQWGKWDSRPCCKEHLDMLEQLVEVRLPYIKGGALRVEKASQIIGRSLCFREDTLFALSLASLYADIGLIGIPDNTLLKEDSLTPEEKKTVDRHTDYGGRLIAKVFPDLPDATEGIWYHHERPDGQGPFGLKEKQIPMVARVVSFTTALNAMANGRPHRPAMAHREILKEVNRNNGQQFCASIVMVFLQLQKELYEVVHMPQENPSASAVADPPPSQCKCHGNDKKCAICSTIEETKHTNAN